MPKLIVLTNKADVTADYLVLAAEEADVSCLRLNTEDLCSTKVSIFPIANDSPVLRTASGRKMELTGALTIYRRPEKPSPPLGFDGNAEFLADQWWPLLTALGDLDGNKWLNSPTMISRAENKLLQMQCAYACGFRVPESVYSNDAATLHRLRQEHESLIVKASGTPLIENLDHPSEFVFTTALGPDAPIPETEVSLCPVLVQERINVMRHLRITVVRNQTYSAHVQPADGDILDWRASAEPPAVSRIVLPGPVSKQAVELVRQMNLQFASMDVLEDENGEFFFLDLNPNGEWGWLQKRAELPIAEAIVGLVR